MKRLLTILLIFPTLVFSQEWELDYLEWDTLFPYQYTLKPDFKEPSQAILINQERKEAISTVSGSIRDYRDSVTFANISILNPQDSSYVTGTIPNEDGHFELNINMSNFIVKFSWIDHLQTVQIEIDKEYFTNNLLKVKLGREQVLDFYVIYSKQKLDSTEVQRVIDCIKPHVNYNPRNVYDCSQGKKYSIGVRI